MIPTLSRADPDAIVTKQGAAGERFVARARVVRAGRNLTVCTGDLYAVKGDGEKVVATMLATMMVMK